MHTSRAMNGVINTVLSNHIFLLQVVNDLLNAQTCKNKLEKAGFWKCPLHCTVSMHERVFNSRGVSSACSSIPSIP